MLTLVLLSGLLVNWSFLSSLVYAAPMAPMANVGHLTFQQYQAEGPQSRATHSTFVRPPEEKPKKTRVQPTPLPSAEPATMKPITQALTGTQTNATMVRASGIKPLALVSSDGRFEVQVAPGAFDLSKARTAQDAAPTGALTLRISQVQGHSTGLVNLLGTYQIQVLDAQQKPLSSVALRVPLTIIYHYQPWEMQALDLNPDHIVLSWPGLSASGTQAAATSTASQAVLFTNNPKTHTLTAQTTSINVKANLSVGSEPNNQSAPTPHFSSVQGNSATSPTPIRCRLLPAQQALPPICNWSTPAVIPMLATARLLPPMTLATAGRSRWDRSPRARKPMSMEWEAPRSTR